MSSVRHHRGGSDGLTRQAAPPSWGKQSQRILVERNLLSRLLTLSDLEDPEDTLSEALALGVEAVGARRGFLGIFPRAMSPGDPPRWWKAVGYSDADLVEIQSKVSRTIIHDALELRRALVIPSAMGHQRYAAQDSVLANNILSVVCAPVGTEARGILYLQERAGGGVFGRDDEAFVSDLGRHLGPVMDRIVLRSDLNAPVDPTAAWRQHGRFAAIVGRGAPLARAMELVSRFAELDEPVLFTGEPGVGKHTMARELHEQSTRAALPFVHVPCAALLGSQATSELFGRLHEGGHGGFLAEARGGTLFLDGVDVLPQDAQAALVAFLERGSWRADGTATGSAPDVRIVASASVLGGETRLASALYHRLSTLRIAVPSLTDRPDDIPRLLEHHGRRAAARHQVPWRGLDAEAALWARSRAWPHNIRDLELLVTRAVVAVEGRHPIRRVDLMGAEEAVEPEVDLGAGFGESWVRLYAPDGELPAWDDAHDAFTRTYLELALERHGGNRTRTALAIGLSKSRLFAVIKKLGVGSATRDD